MEKLFVDSTREIVIMKLAERISSLVELGQRIKAQDDKLEEVKIRAKVTNPWFTISSIDTALSAIADKMLSKSNLEDWISNYKIQDDENSKTVGLVLAGNIPLVGFHDVLSVYLSGHKAMIKLSSKDEVLMNYLIEQLIDIDERNQDYFKVVDRLEGYDAVIATGSNSSAIHFERYFKHIPHIIRKNRQSIAVLESDISDDEIVALGKDIFTYFGLGCRNVAKIYVPEGFDFVNLLRVLEEHYEDIIHHHKYKNNFDYNMALFMLNKEEFLHNGCILLKKDDSIHSRIACLNYELYTDKASLAEKLKNSQDEIQCIVSNEAIEGLEVVPIGAAQEPELMDYADGVDTMAFLESLS